MFKRGSRTPGQKKASEADWDFDAFPMPWHEPPFYPWRADWLAALGTENTERLFQIFRHPGLTPSDRALMINVAAQRLPAGRKWILNKMPAEEPLTLMLHACVAFHDAADARGTGTGDTVSNEAAHTFIAESHRAFALAEQAYEKSEDPAARAIQQPFSLGMHPPHSDELPIMEIFSRWNALDPWNLAGWMSLARCADERWSGDPELQLNLAGHIAEEAPEGHPVLQCVPSYINQRFDYLLLFERGSNDGIPEINRSRDAFYSHPAIRDILKKGWDRFSAAAPDAKINYPAYSSFVVPLSLAGFTQEAFEALWRSRGYYLPGVPLVYGSKVKLSGGSAQSWRTYVIYEALAGPGFKKQPQIRF